MKITQPILRLFLNWQATDIKTLLSWSKTSRAYKKRIPYCEVCGDRTPKKLQVHHCIPQQECKRQNRLDLILDERNLIAACYSCHLQVCHKGNFKLYRPGIRSIAEYIEKCDDIQEALDNE